MVRGSHPDIGFELDVEGTTVVADPKIFARILDNLLSNAAKYSDKGSRVRVRFARRDKKLVIEDSGRGIRRPEKVFERFYKEGETGHGIGMHIVKKLCDSLGVKIEVESEPGRGTRISLDLGPILSESAAR
jgi:signal transduction histidine kinase